MTEPNRRQSAPDREGPSAAPDPAAATGTTDGDILAGTPYRGLRPIAAGGMGTVIEAEHKALGKPVVVKLLLPKYAREPRLVERLKREARVLARVASPHIVTVSDLGQTADGSTYLVMERLHGHTLRRELVLRGGVLPVAEAIRWTRQVLAGLGAAHREGIVHRDVKLDNVLLCDATEHEPRRIKVLDFGIAKVLKDAAPGLDGSRNQLTAEGALLGSPRWLAPEQARGKAVDARADVYAVGLLLYTLVAGRGPFSHVQDAIEAIQASVDEQPAPPSRYAPQDVPAALDDAVLLALEKEPDHRFQSAEAFSNALESITAVLEDVTEPLLGRPAWREAPASLAASQAEVRESTAPTLPCKPGVEPFADAQRDSAEPTLVRPPRAGDLVTPPRERPGISVFVALTAASALVFSLLFALVARFTGGR